jgi:hypothetical protein
VLSRSRSKDRAARRDDIPPILPRVIPGPARLHRSLVPAEVDAHRTLFCEHYGACLDVATDWPGWSCQGCPLQRDHRRLFDLAEVYFALVSRE